MKHERIIAPKGKVAWICARDDYSDQVVKEQELKISSLYAPAAEKAGMDFSFLDAAELVPFCDGKVQLLQNGRDLLAEKQCFLVSNFSWRPQTERFLNSICNAIEYSSSILLNSNRRSAHSGVNDKFLMTAVAASCEVPTIGTLQLPYGTHIRNTVSEITDKLGAGPYIIKPNALGMGYAVMQADNLSSLSSILDVVAQSGCDYIVQPQLSSVGDLRVYILEGEVIASQKRIPEEGSHLANISQGGQGSSVVPDERIVADSLKIFDRLGAEFLAVDWLLTEDGYYFNEWSSATVGMNGLPEPEKSRCAERFFSWISKNFHSSTISR